MANPTQLTPRGALLLALVCVASGVFPILAGVGIVPIRLENDTPGWIAVAAGSTFLLAGGALVVDALAGGIGPGGDLPAGTKPGLRAAQNVCGFGIVVLFATIASWIAFGKGERHFTTTISLPFMWARQSHSDASGRWAFGACAVLLWIVVLAVSVKSARRLLAPRQRL